jgi:hypothetical protein
MGRTGTVAGVRVCCACVQSELGRLHGNVDVLQLKVKEQREEVAAGRKELKHVKRTVRTLEVGGGALSCNFWLLAGCL